MPYAFPLPTTSSLSFQSFLRSPSHASLPPAATAHRTFLQSVLKKHKRLKDQPKASDLQNVLTALNDYLPYLFALDTGLSGQTISGEEIDVVLERQIEVAWRPTLAASIPGREPARVTGEGLDYELCYILSTLGCTYALLARTQLQTLYAPLSLSTEQRSSIITTATKYLLQANSIHTYAMSRATEVTLPSSAVNVTFSTQGALAALALAEATLLAVLKDDPYPAVVSQDRNKNDREWMVKAPEIAKVRAHLFARLCLVAAEHATKAEVMLGKSDILKRDSIDESLVSYISNLRKTARAKACRFFGIDAELADKTGEGLAWLMAGRKELGFGTVSADGIKMRGLAKLKKDWNEHREDKKIEKGGEWGSDAGRLEEFRIIEMLEKKWNKMNDTVRATLGLDLRLTETETDQYSNCTTFSATNSQYAFG